MQGLKIIFMKCLTLGLCWLLLAWPVPTLAGVQKDDPVAVIETSYDRSKDRTTVHLTPVQVSGEKDKYYSLHLAASFTYQGQVQSKPEAIDVELQSIVKARSLNTDLYVVFIVDGETLFLSSNRSARKNPVPGRRWIGERLVFRTPYETFKRIANATTLKIKMDAVVFPVGNDHLAALRQFWRKINPDFPY
jgi:hypothetical protein